METKGLDMALVEHILTYFVAIDPQPTTSKYLTLKIEKCLLWDLDILIYMTYILDKSNKYVKMYAQTS